MKHGGLKKNKNYSGVHVQIVDVAIVAAAATANTRAKIKYETLWAQKNFDLVFIWDLT